MSKNLPLKKIPMAPAAGPILQALSPLDLLRAYTELKTVELQEQTKILAIRAQRDIAVKRLRLQRKLILEVCEKVFAERRAALEKLFDLLDKSVEAKDEKGLDASLRGIAAIVTSSPFMGFAEFEKVMQGGAPALEL
jgi:hypothetical protein